VSNSVLPRANVLGLGLIGGSIALALVNAGYDVGATDADEARLAEAVRRGIIQHIGLFEDAVITFVATPVALLPDGVAVALDGLDGADATMFEGAVWVLTPNAATSDDAFAAVAEMVTGFGAEVVALDPKKHDDLVAVVSHVPHLTAATLMRLADDRSEEHLALLRLAAGGFRDMTRIASGRPGIWLDICEENKDAIVRGLDAVIEGLIDMREVVSTSDRKGLLHRLEQARRARMNLPSKAGAVEDLSEIRIPIPDRPGAAAEVFALSGELGVNIYDFEVVHSAEGDRGVMVAVIRMEHGDIFRGGLLARGFRPALAPLS
jgi:prephenate dehydrogenase